jgi:predicted ribosomally synthesized peptide with nif11-like leader
MAEDAVKAFVERLTTDEEFAKKVADAPSKEERLRIINEAGYALTASDLSALKAALNVEELSDEDLEKVAGGNSSAVCAGVGSAVGGMSAGVSVMSAAIATAAAAAAIF